MAIQFARVDIISRKAGGSAVGISSYISRSQRSNESTGRVYYFGHKKDDLFYYDVMLPKGAPKWAKDGVVLWNRAEACEKRKDSQLAKHMVLALPKELSQAEQKDLTEQFIEKHFTDVGVAVEFALHKPHKGEENYHAHLVISTRYLEAEGFTRKAVELNPEFAKGKNGKGFVSVSDVWGEKWAEFQNQYFKEHNINLTVDGISVQPGVHLKDSRFIDSSAKVVENEIRAQEAREIITKDPEAVLNALTWNKSYFSERDVARYLFKAGLSGEEFDQVKSAVLLKSIPLYEREDNTDSGYYTTEKIRQSELSVLAFAERLAKRSGHKVPEAKALEIMVDKKLSPEQQAAFMGAVGGSDLTLWRGVAGAGKSYAMNAVRETYAEQGYEIIGLAPTNTVARDMGQNGFTEARTLHSFLGRVERGTQDINSRTILMVDEAAMVSTSILERVLSHADQAKAKVILIGDDRQLASIERGGMFGELKERHQTYELRDIRRQKEEWSKEASLNFADGKFKEGLKAYEERGYIHWGESLEETKALLVKKWEEQYDQDSTRIRFVYAQTNKDVNELNASLRETLKAKGVLDEEHTFDTERGKIALSSGDRVQFYENDYQQKIFNGYCGVVQEIKDKNLWVKLDHGQVVCIDNEVFKGFGHGYAGTVYRGQGKTQVETSYLHTPLAESRTSYVALTRHQEACRVFVAKETTKDIENLASQMSRSVEKGSSLKYATHEEMTQNKTKSLFDLLKDLKPISKGELQFKEAHVALEKLNRKVQSEKLEKAVAQLDLLRDLKPITEEKLQFKEASAALEKLNRQVEIEKLEKAAQSLDVQEAYKKFNTFVQDHQSHQEKALKTFKEVEHKLSLIETDHAERNKKEEVILPSEKAALLRQQQEYIKAFVNYAKESPVEAGNYAQEVCEKYRYIRRYELEEADKVKLKGAGQALEEAIKRTEGTREYNEDRAYEWKRSIKLEHSLTREKGLGYGISMGR